MQNFLRDVSIPLGLRMDVSNAAVALCNAQLAYSVALLHESPCGCDMALNDLQVAEAASLQAQQMLLLHIRNAYV